MNETPPAGDLASNLEPGHVLGEVYRIVRRIGQSDDGVTYEAEHLRLNRPVAVKTLHGRQTDGGEALARLTREAEHASKLHHPHIVEVLDFDRTPGKIPYLVHELLKGESLESLLHREETFDLGRGLRIGVQVASALTAAHAAGIGHGALTPAQVFLVTTTEDPFAKVLDFGMHRATPTSKSGSHSLRPGKQSVSKKSPYAAPDDAANRGDDLQRDDQYALAAIIYEMFTGRPPASDGGMLGFFKRSSDTIPPPSKHRGGIPPSVDRVLLRALSRRRDDRFPMMKDFSAALLEAGRGYLKSRRPLIPSPEGVESQIPFSRNRSAPPRAASTPAARGASTPTAPRVTTPPAGRVPREHDVHARKTMAVSPQARAGEQPSEKPTPTTSDQNDVEALLRSVRTGGTGSAGIKAALELVHRAAAAQSAHAERRVADNRESLEKLFTDYLGGLDATGELVRYPTATEQVSTTHVFILSRLEGEATWGQVLQLSPLPRLESLALLAELLDRGLARRR